MNRLKVWLYTALVAGAGAAALVVLSRGTAQDALAQLDRRVSAGVAQADVRLQLLAAQAGRVAERMARDPALSQALGAEASEAELTRALATALRDDPGEAAGLAVAAVGSRGAARFAGPSPAPELEQLLSAARDGRRVETYLFARGSLHRAVALPVGLGAAVAVAVPAGSAWLRQVRAATSCEVTVAVAARPVESTLPATQAALVAEAAPPGGGATLAAGVLAPQPLSLPWRVPLPPLPLLFVEAPAHRVGAVSLEGVPAGALVLSQAAAGIMTPVVTYGWVGLVGLALLFLAGLVVGLLVSEEHRMALPKNLLIAADRIGRGDFTARAPPLVGRLGIIASALNRAAEAAWTPPSPVPPAATGAAPFGVAVLSGLPAAPPAGSFVDGPAEAEPAPSAEQRGETPAREERLGREETLAREETPAGESVPQAEPETVAPPAEGNFSDAAPGKPVEPRGEPTAAPADAWLEAPASGSNQGGAATAAAPRPATRDRTATDFFGVPPPEPTGWVPADEDEEHWKAVYQDFLRVRTDCGEPREGVAYERFRQKLQKNRDQLVERYGCRTVRFQVYVKEGKAALKASPVR